MELRQLATFRQLARTLNFTRTATALNYVQSNVTAQIQALEEELGVRLFDRLGRRVALTEVGERLLRYAEQILDLSEEMYEVASTQEDPRGTLVVSAHEPLCTYLVPRLFYHLHNRYPHVNLQFRPAAAAEISRQVNEGTLDIAIILEQSVHSAKLVVQPLFPEPLCVIAAPWHPLVGIEQIKPVEMENETILLTEGRCSYRSLFEHSLARAGVQPAVVIEVTNAEAVKQCVMVGMGISVLPQMAVRAEVDQGKIAVLPWELQDAQLFVQMIWHKEKWLSPAMQALIAAVEQVEWQ
ncbi:LysR family transcriptional regulator [Dictyobacter alpinus]|uniref:LysR family transcriptional regulator n=1 Tax=Dictyobacter alpinus TaxID=2014873 RepID=A0A402B9W5_9CHLR|nr:LysR family transcriptional regulator [Dictyobacter alpinus]GCE28107.1 LysR family transcriptional regulator [Dictyobacter alpinus]